MLKKKKGKKNQKTSPASPKKKNKKSPVRKKTRVQKKIQKKIQKKTKPSKIKKVIKRVKKKTKITRKAQVGKGKSAAKKPSTLKKSPVMKREAVAKKPVVEKSSTVIRVKAVKTVQAEPVEKRRSTLSPSRKEALRRILLEKKEEVWKDVKQKLFVQMGKEYREEVDVALDDGDKAMVDLAAETGISLLDMRTDLLDKIDRAIGKLDEGTYGICEDCGADIHENRLKVVPFAIYCIDCKTKREEMESIAKEPDRFAATGPEELD